MSIFALIGSAQPWRGRRALAALALAATPAAVSPALADPATDQPLVMAARPSEARALSARPGSNITSLLERLGPGSYTLPAGTFRGIDIDLKNGVRLYGQGAGKTKIELPRGSINSRRRQEHIYLFDLTDSRGVRLSGLRLDGNKAGQVLHNTVTSPRPGWYAGRENGGWHVIQANGAHDLVLTGIDAVNAGTDGLNIGEGARNIRIVDSTFDGNRRQGVSVKEVDGLHFTNVSFSDTGGQKPEAGVDIEPNNGSDRVSNVSFRNSRFHGNNGAGLMVDSRGAPITGLLIENSSFTGDRSVEVKGRKEDGDTAVLKQVVIVKNKIGGNIILGGSGDGGGVHQKTTLRDNRIGGRVLVQKAGRGSSFIIKDNYTPSGGKVPVIYRD